MREAVGLVAALYVVAYLLAQARRRPAHLVVICPLRGDAVPEEVRERLGAPTRVEARHRLPAADFTVGYLVEGPGISLGSITDEASLQERLGPYLERSLFAPQREAALGWLHGHRKWSAAMLCGLALEVLHARPPASLRVDFRPPPAEVARARGVSASETDLDLGMCAYEIYCRLRQYSRYRDARFELLFCDEEGAWSLTA